MKSKKNKVVEYELQLIAHSASAFDTNVVLNGSSNWHRIVNIIKYGKRIISLKVFSRNLKISENKYVAQNINFICGMTHINGSLKKIGNT